MDIGNGTRQPRDATAEGAGALLLGIAAFQAALAAGAPWGAAAYGGSHPGVLPGNLRATSAVAGTVYTVLASVTATGVAAPAARRRVMYGTAGLMAAGTVANLASPSLVERMVWVPVTLVTAVLLRRAAARIAPR